MRKRFSVFTSIINCGFPRGTDISTMRRVRIIAVMSLLPAAAALVFIVDNTLDGRLLFSAIDLLFAVILSGNYIYLCLRKNVKTSAAILTVISLAVSFYLLLHGGSAGTGYVWCLFFPVTVTFVLGARIGGIVNAGFFITASGFLLIPDNPILLVEYSPGLKIDFLSALAALSLVAWYSEKSRQKTEGRLSLRERRFRALIEKSPSVSAIIDTDGTVLYESPSLKRVYGYRPEELVGTNIMELVHPDDVPAAMKKMRELIEKPDLDDKIELRYRHKNGSWRYIEVSGVNLINDPAVKGMVLTSHDVTILKTLSDTLEERVRERTEELKQSEARLRHAEKMQAIGQLAGGIAHDFNNQLTGIMGCADWMRVNLEKDPKLHECAEAILTAAHDSAALTSQLLVFARRSKNESAPVDIHALTGDVVKLLERSIDRRISIEQHLTARETLVLGDRAQLENALLNIALNARDAMPEGGTISILTKSISIGRDGQYGTPNDLGPGKYLSLTIQDTGSGIEPEVEGRIFEPFFTTKSQGSGTGMGLAAVYGTIQTHGGQIRVSSESGRGTSFSIYLPLDEELSTCPEKEYFVSNSMTEGEGLVLVIDDDENVSRMLNMVLKKLGYTVHRCASGDEAVEWYAGSWKAVSVIILDMMMPGISSAETFARLREINSGAGVIISSGYTMNSSVQKILDSGALCFIKKPYEISELAKRIAEAKNRYGVKG